MNPQNYDRTQRNDDDNDDDNDNDANGNDNGNDNDRAMNDSTLPPGTKARPVRTARTATTKNRKKSRFGLADWTRLLASTTDLAQRKGKPIRRHISIQEVQQHRTIHDGWIILKGKVYNISPYLQYHPGGTKIIQPFLGRDVTTLYEKYHRWVNEDGLIGKLLLGYLDTSRRAVAEDSSDDDNNNKPASSSHTPVFGKDGFAVPAPRRPTGGRRDNV